LVQSLLYLATFFNIITALKTVMKKHTGVGFVSIVVFDAITFAI